MLWWLVALAVAVTGAANAAASLFFIASTWHGRALAFMWAAGALMTLILGWRSPARTFTAFAVAAALWATWWLTITPSNARNWEAEYSRQPVGELNGTLLTVDNVRNFEWRKDGPPVERWEKRVYDLDKLDRIDLFASYWSGKLMAHLILTFAFSDGQHLAISVETRREKGEEWSAAAGFFKAYELAYVVADERDVVRLRTNVRGEDVRLYRLKASEPMRKRLLLQYVNEMNRAREQPRFYHTILTNCTTQIVRIAAAAGHRFPFDWRLIASGYVPEYLFGLALLDMRLPFAELAEKAAISVKAKAADTDPAFSQRIREGVPAP